VTALAEVLLRAIVVLTGTALATFALLWHAPGDPALAIAVARYDTVVSPDVIARIRVEARLDAGFWSAFGHWIAALPAFRGARLRCRPAARARRCDAGGDGGPASQEKARVIVESPHLTARPRDAAVPDAAARGECRHGIRVPSGRSPRGNRIRRSGRLDHACLANFTTMTLASELLYYNFLCDRKSPASN